MAVVISKLKRKYCWYCCCLLLLFKQWPN